MDIEFLKDAVRDLVNDVSSGASVGLIQVKVSRILEGLDKQKVRLSAGWEDRANKAEDRANKAEEKLAAMQAAQPVEFNLRLHELKKLLQRAAVGPNGQKILDECLSLAAMLIEKNIAYGNSALNPVRIFARDLDPKAQILVRLDDKLSRLARGSAAGEDVILDLLGYLILYRISDATVTAPAVAPEKSVHPFDNIKVRAPTPEEVEKLKAAAEESEKNSPYQPKKRAYLGISTVPMGNGLMIARVEGRSPAERSGVKVGDLLMRINEETPRTHDELTHLLATWTPGLHIVLVVHRYGEASRIHVELATITSISGTP